jgi:hypothetical protein
MGAVLTLRKKSLWGRSQTQIGTLHYDISRLFKYLVDTDIANIKETLEVCYLLILFIHPELRGLDRIPLPGCHFHYIVFRDLYRSLNIKGGGEAGNHRLNVHEFEKCECQNKGH